MKKFVIKKIEDRGRDSSKSEIVKRLMDLGLYPGIEVEVVMKLSFGSVIIIQYGSTRLALNKQEFLCLHGH